MQTMFLSMQTNKHANLGSHSRAIETQELDVLPGKASTIINASLASFSRLKTEAIEKGKALSI